MSVESVFEHREQVRKPGWQKALPWIVGVVVVGAVLGFVGYKWSNTGESTAPPLTHLPADARSAVPATVKLTPEATRVAREFIQTAVARKNLPKAYGLVTEQIKQGQTLKSWNSGNIAVIPYPVDAIKYAPMKIDFSYPSEAQIQVALLPKPGVKVRSQLFLMDLVKRNGKWLVNSWVPRSTPPVPNGSAKNGAGGQPSPNARSALVAPVPPPVVLERRVADGRRCSNRGCDCRREHGRVEQDTAVRPAGVGLPRAGADEADRRGPRGALPDVLALHPDGGRAEASRFGVGDARARDARGSDAQVVGHGVQQRDPVSRSGHRDVGHPLCLQG